ncbi:hypothetical protein PSTT_02779 [Puccinia striiformis]|uniref:Uncharacterized protein n=1 Tax=Puccinia striiformis TaxID=27350 RepID=A0A2S4VYT5_9BASI|nr:hypothetical protein PSTT_02779 [Puccinia striiformis]
MSRASRSSFSGPNSASKQTRQPINPRRTSSRPRDIRDGRPHAGAEREARGSRGTRKLGACRERASLFALIERPLAQQRQSPSILATSGASSSSCAPPPRTSSATDELTRETKIKLQGILAESLDDLLAVYADLVVGSAEDRVMKPELENLRTYFRRTARTSKAQDGRQGLIVGTTRRFIHHGVGSGRARQTIQKTPANPTSSPKIAADLQEQDEDEDTHKGSGESKKARLAAPEIGKKIRAGRLARNHGLPQIRQVVKPSRPCYKENNVGGMVEGDKEEEDDDDSDSDDDGELEVYDD